MSDFDFPPIDPKYLPDPKLWADDVAERSAQAVYKRLSEELPLTPEDLGTATNDYDVVLENDATIAFRGEQGPLVGVDYAGDMLIGVDPGDEDDTKL